ncbi:hypothetical protein GCM10010464_03650 [Pseudonocardia yunnanensis]|uniref:Uncharacterized protein n=1 Tax=Pseudonocardia yunnanensis TaxID=58107 RepID=A0ABW4EX29_9PSEU
MLVVVVVGGLIMVGLAIVLGILESRTLQAAWGRVAVVRREVEDRARELDQRELAIEMREEQLDRRERRLDYREELQLGREEALARLEALDPEQPV